MPNFPQHPPRTFKKALKLVVIEMQPLTFKRAKITSKAKFERFFHKWGENKQYRIDPSNEPADFSKRLPRYSDMMTNWQSDMDEERRISTNIMVTDRNFCGSGIYTWPNGSKYYGHWKDGKRNGHGIKFDADGNKIYEGYWMNDHKSLV